MDVVASRFNDATDLNAAGVGDKGPALKKGVTFGTGEDVGNLKARIEEMKRSMAGGQDGDDDDDFGSGYGDFDDLEETKSR